MPRGRTTIYTNTRLLHATLSDRIYELHRVVETLKEIARQDSINTAVALEECKDRISRLENRLTALEESQKVASGKKAFTDNYTNQRIEKLHKKIEQLAITIPDDDNLNDRLHSIDERLCEVEAWKDSSHSHTPKAETQPEEDYSLNSFGENLKIAMTHMNKQVQIVFDTLNAPVHKPSIDTARLRAQKIKAKRNPDKNEFPDTERCD